MTLFTLLACVHHPAPAPPATSTADAAPAPASTGDPPSDLPRVLVSPDRYAMTDAPAGVPLRVVGVSVFGAGPIVIPLGEGTGTPEEEPPCAGNLLVDADWRAQQDVGREIVAIPPNQAKYRAIFEETTGRDDFTVEALWRVDLEGDGQDEVLFDLAAAGETFGWSYLGVRRIVGNEVQTVTLHEGSWSVDDGLDDDARAQAIEQARPNFTAADLYGVTDIDGDGELEIVVSFSAWEASGYGLTTAAGQPIGGAGCGV